MFTVSIVTYKHTLTEIRSLVDLILASECRCLYIVDNGCDPELEREISSLQEKKLCYVPMTCNAGFGAGHNVAIRRAMESKADYHMIINPDISFVPGTLEKIVHFMDTLPEAALVMPKTRSPGGQLQRNCKLVPSPADLIFKRFLPPWMKRARMKRFMMYEYDHDMLLDVPYLCGCFMVFRCAVLKETGLFDERFFMYPEDIDITRRIFSAGYRTLYYPDAEVTHEHAQASYKNAYMLWIHIVNMIRYFNKWGWIFDRERAVLNKRTHDLNRDKRLS